MVPQMVEFFKPGLPALLIVLLMAFSWRAWLRSDKALTGRRKTIFRIGMYVASANTALAAGLWFYFWNVPFSGIQIIHLALALGFPVSAAALILLVLGRGRGWWLAALSSAITLAGWIVAYCNLSR